MTLHEFLDTNYGPDGDRLLLLRLSNGDDVEARSPNGETPLNVAVRRRRASAASILLDHGAEINAPNKHGKSAYAHAIRRGFSEIVDLLLERGADPSLTPADQFAVAVVTGKLEMAKDILREHPEVVRTGNPEEDRLLADVAGRSKTEPVEMLIGAGADLAAPGVDDGTPLHQAAWFGQPANARLLIEADAPLENFDEIHESSPLGWAIHGSRYSGGANERQEVYVEIVKMLMAAGAKLTYPDTPEKPDYLLRLRNDAMEAVRLLLPDQL